MLTKVRVGGATITLSRTAVDDDVRAEVVLDCPHSTTSAFYMEPHEAEVELSDRDLVLLTCRKALQETPCPCVRSVIEEYGHGW